MIRSFNTKQSPHSTQQAIMRMHIRVNVDKVLSATMGDGFVKWLRSTTSPRTRIFCRYLASDKNALTCCATQQIVCLKGKTFTRTHCPTAEAQRDVQVMSNTAAPELVLATPSISHSTVQWFGYQSLRHCIMNVALRSHNVEVFRKNVVADNGSTVPSEVTDDAYMA